MLFNNPWYAYLLVFLLTFFLIGYLFFKKKLSYWKDRNVPGPQPLPLIGNLWKALSLQVGIGQVLKEFYDSEEGPVVGIFTLDEPMLLIRSLEIVKQICVKDFQFFSDRVTTPPKHNNYTSNILLMQKNPKWKLLRAQLTPLFSSAKLKMTFNIIKEVGHDMVSFLKEKPGLHDGKQILYEFSTEVVSRCFFGISAECFTNEKSLIKQKTYEMFERTNRNIFCQSAYFFKPKLVDLFHLEFFTKSVQQFFVKLFWDCLKKNEDGQISSFRFMDLLNEIRNKDPSFDDYKMVGQGLSFFAAGTETTSTALSFCAYELCMNPNIQLKLRLDIETIIKNHGELTYESIQKMKYLELCILEALRKYPPLPFLDRRCSTEYKIPGTNIVLEKGTGIYIPIFGIQNDSRYFPNPEKYYPERFIENPEAAKMVLSFGFGPRNCIGGRFGMLITKIALVSIIKNFELKPVPGTPTVIKMCPKVVTLTSIIGFPMDFVPIYK